MAAWNLDRLFDPRAIAVIGASQDTSSISGQPLKHLKGQGYRGRLYPVNPKYGEVLDSWTTKISAEMQQSNGAGNTLEKVKSLGGLTTYRDVKDLTQGNLVGPPLVVEIEKSTDDMAKSPGNGQFTLTNGAPQAVMRALSKSEVYFSRPTDDSALAWFKRVSDAHAYPAGMRLREEGIQLAREQGAGVVEVLLGARLGGGDALERLVENADDPLLHGDGLGVLH